MSAWQDVLQSIGGAVGTAGGAVATWVASKIKAAEEAATKAVAARDEALAVLKRMREELEALDTLKRGIRLEIDHARETSAPYRSPAPSTPFEPGAPSNGELGRRLDVFERTLENLRQDIMRERSARHAMQHQLVEDGREDEKQWREIVRDLAEIQGLLRRGR